MTYQQRIENDYIDFIIRRLEAIKKDYKDQCNKINANCEEYQCDEYDCPLAENDEALSGAIYRLNKMKFKEE